MNSRIATISIPVFVCAALLLFACAQDERIQKQVEPQKKRVVKKETLEKKTAVKEAFTGPYFNEFTEHVHHAMEFRKFMTDRGFLPGISASVFDSSDDERIIFAVTEKRSKKEIDDFVNQAVRFYDENPV